MELLTRRGFVTGAIGLGGAAILLAADKKKVAPGEGLFGRPKVIEIRLALSPEAQELLRKTPREWVEAAATIDGIDLARLSIHLKGTTSFMPLDKKPSFTLGIDRGAPGRRLWGLKKVHLNNSVQDTSLICEDLCGQLFRRAGVPCARAAWARVRLDDRDLGLYVVKEAEGAEFLALHFARTDGNYYDGGLHHDVFNPLPLDSGAGVQDRSDLKALLTAANTPDPAARWAAMAKVIDLDRLISMMAMEALTCHIDGYSMMQNNYRIYFDPANDGRAVLIAHGLDRMLKEPDYPLEPKFRGVLAKGAIATPEGRVAYRKRLAELAEKEFAAAWIAKRIAEVAELLGKIDARVGESGRRLGERVAGRVAFVKWQLPAGWQ